MLPKDIGKENEPARTGVYFTVKVVVVPPPASVVLTGAEITGEAVTLVSAPAVADESVRSARPELVIV